MKGIKAIVRQHLAAMLEEDKQRHMETPPHRPVFALASWRETTKRPDGTKMRETVSLLDDDTSPRDLDIDATSTALAIMRNALAMCGMCRRLPRSERCSCASTALARTSDESWSSRYSMPSYAFRR